MIVYDEGPSLRLITQPDHAHFAGQLLALWCTDGLPANPRREEILFAAREHDNGWREEDAAPRWDAGHRRPVDFLGTAGSDRIEIWERGVARFAGSHPYAALLITRHAEALHEGHRGDPAWDPFLAFLHDLDGELMAETGTGAEEVAADYRLIDLVDRLSLVVCNGWRDPFTHRGISGTFDGTTLRLDPLPLAGATAFTLPCRHVARRDYRGDADLGGELAAARWEMLRIRVASREGER